MLVKIADAYTCNKKTYNNAISAWRLRTLIQRMVPPDSPQSASTGRFATSAAAPML
jgi:hypothetical protein